MELEDVSPAFVPGQASFSADYSLSPVRIMGGTARQFFSMRGIKAIRTAGSNAESATFVALLIEPEAQIL